MSNKIRFFREEIRMPLDGLAQLTGIGRWKLRSYELGQQEPSEQSKLVICKFLGQELEEVFPSESDS